MIDAILVDRETGGSIPCKVFGLNVSRVQRNFKTLILHFTQVGGDSAETGETRQTLSHNHVSSLLEIILHRTGQTVAQYREIHPDIPGVRLFPLQVRSSQTVHIQRINHCCCAVVDIDHTGAAQVQVGQRFVYVAKVTVTVGTPRCTQFKHIQPLLSTFHEFLVRNSPT